MGMGWGLSPWAGTAPRCWAGRRAGSSKGLPTQLFANPPLVKHKMPGGGRDRVWLLVDSSPLFLGFLSSLPLAWGLSRAR